MIRFLSKVKNSPIHAESKPLRLLNPFEIVAKAKDEEPLLKLADAVSDSVYQRVNKSGANYHIPEPRYFFELSTRFSPDHKGLGLGKGLKPIHNIDQLE
jgi:hypothetical protein